MLCPQAALLTALFNSPHKRKICQICLNCRTLPLQVSFAGCVECLVVNSGPRSKRGRFGCHCACRSPHRCSFQSGGSVYSSAPLLMHTPYQQHAFLTRVLLMVLPLVKQNAAVPPDTHNLLCSTPGVWPAVAHGRFWGAARIADCMCMVGRV